MLFKTYFWWTNGFKLTKSYKKATQALKATKPFPSDQSTNLIFKTIFNQKKKVFENSTLAVSLHPFIFVVFNMLPMQFLSTVVTETKVTLALRNSHKQPGVSDEIRHEIQVVTNIHHECQNKSCASSYTQIIWSSWRVVLSLCVSK